MARPALASAGRRKRGIGRMPWPGFEPGCLAALPPQDSVSTSFTTRAGRRKLESVPGGVNRCGAARRCALDWCPMELWVAFGFGALIGAFIGTIIGRQRAAARGAAAPTVAPPPPAARFAPPEVQHVVLDEGSANVLNALNNRLAAGGGGATGGAAARRAAARCRPMIVPMNAPISAP